MKQQKTINLENAYKMLKEGYEIAIPNADNTYSVGYIWMGCNKHTGKESLAYCNIGNCNVYAAVDATLRDLRWIFTEVMGRYDYMFVPVTYRR